MLWQRLRSFLTPSPGPLVLVWAALIEWGALSLLGAVLNLPGASGLDSVFLCSGVAAGFGGGMLILATVVERRAGARAVLWLGNVFFLTLSSGSFLLPSLLPGSQLADGALVVMVVCCLPLEGLMAVIFLILVWRAGPEFRRVLRVARAQRAMQIVQARGEPTFDEIASETGQSPDQVVSLLRELASAGELMAVLDLPRRRVYSAAALAEKQRLLAAVILARGQASLDELAGELRAPLDLLSAWIYQLARRGQFHGFVDWKRGVVVSQEGRSPDDENQCPHCGGDMNMAGKGVIECIYCGVEVFV